MIETVLFAAVMLLNLWGARHFRNTARTVNARETGDALAPTTPTETGDTK